MSLVNLKLHEGVGKNSKKPYYMVTILAQKYTSEPIFVSQLEYDYLQELVDDKDSGVFDLDNEN